MRDHWPEYLMEAAALGIFMLSAGFFGTLLEAESSPVKAAIGNPFARRMLMGVAMGVTAILLIYSPWGRRSGAHMNPAVTLTFWRLGKIESKDAIYYCIFQFLGGLLGVVIVEQLVGRPFSDAPVSYVVTVPGPAGPGAALLAELIISALLMIVVLISASSPRYQRYTGCMAGALVALYIAFEAPLSGFSMNPARTLASAIPSDIWTGWWLYMLAPTIGMLLAAEVHRRLTRSCAKHCAKLMHCPRKRCIFCGWRPVHGETDGVEAEVMAEVVSTAA